MVAWRIPDLDDMFFACIDFEGVLFFCWAKLARRFGGISCLCFTCSLSALILVLDGAEVVALPAYTICPFLNQLFDSISKPLERSYQVIVGQRVGHGVRLSGGGEAFSVVPVG